MPEPADLEAVLRSVLGIRIFAVTGRIMGASTSCLTETTTKGGAAARSREAARSAASALAHNEDDEPAAEGDRVPFRRQE